MTKYRGKNNKYIGRFKSHTDINNYNKLLLELDKKQQDKQLDKRQVDFIDETFTKKK